MARAEHHRPGVDVAVARPPLRRAVREGDPAERLGRLGHRVDQVAPRVGPGGERSPAQAGQHASVGPVQELAGSALRCLVLAPALRGHEQRDQLTRLELDLGEVVLLLRDHVALLRPPDVDVHELEGHAVLAEHVLVALEHPLRAVRVGLSVRLQDLPDLLEREGPRGLEEEADEVQQALEWLRAVALPHRCGIISTPCSPTGTTRDPHPPRGRPQCHGDPARSPGAPGRDRRRGGARGGVPSDERRRGAGGRRDPQHDGGGSRAGDGRRASGHRGRRAGGGRGDAARPRDEGQVHATPDGGRERRGVALDAPGGVAGSRPDAGGLCAAALDDRADRGGREARVGRTGRLPDDGWRGPPRRVLQARGRAPRASVCSMAGSRAGRPSGASSRRSRCGPGCSRRRSCSRPR